MSQIIVGRCPIAGHEILLEDDGFVKFTCSDPGRADGIYAASMGLVPVRDATGGTPGQRELITGVVPLTASPVLKDPVAAMTAATTATPVAPAGPASVVTGV